MTAAKPLLRASLALLLALASTALFGSAEEAEAAQAKVDKRPTVAVLYFDYQGKSDEMSQLRKGLAQMLVSDLSHLDDVRIVERDRLQEILDELELNKTGKIDKATANRIGKLLGAKYMVLGGYFDLLGTLRVDARVVEVETGKVVKSFGANGKADEFLTIEQQVAGDLEALLTSGTLKGFAAVKRPAKTKRVAKRRPKKLKASTAARYGKALDAKDRGDKAAAKKELEAVVAEAPDFTLAQADLDAMIQ